MRQAPTIAVFGLSGAGKTTLIKQVSSSLEADARGYRSNLTPLRLEMRVVRAENDARFQVLVCGRVQLVRHASSRV